MKAVFRKVISVIALLLAAMLFSGCITFDFSGIHEASASEPAAEAVTEEPLTEAPATELPTETPQPTEAVPAVSPSPSPSPRPTLEPEPATPEQIAEASALADEYGIDEASLHGRHALFLRYSEHLEGNESIGEYKPYFYRIFPVIADNVSYLDEEYFFSCLDALTVEDAGDDERYAGEYHEDTNSISFYNTGEGVLERTIYHELIHFIDFCIAKEPPSFHMLNGVVLTTEEYEALSPSDKIKSRDIATSKLYSPAEIEGGAELFTAKYFTGAITAYPAACAFMTGLEYIYGEDHVRELFFSPDSAILWAKLYFEAGYGYNDCFVLNRYLAFLTDAVKFADYADGTAPYSAEEVLIRLYEAHMPGDWREDSRFLYILCCINGMGGDDYLRSQYADDLAGSVFATETDYLIFERSLLDCIDDPVFYLSFIPVPLFLEGDFLITAPALWLTDDQNDMIVHGTLRVDFDFDRQEVLGCTLVPAE